MSVDVRQGTGDCYLCTVLSLCDLSLVDSVSRAHRLIALTSPIFTPPFIQELWGTLSQSLSLIPGFASETILNLLINTQLPKMFLSAFASVAPLPLP